MQCEQVEAHLDAYLERDLSEDIYQRIYAHLETCDKCCRVLEDSKRVYDNLHNWNDMPVPSEFIPQSWNISHPKLHQSFYNKSISSWSQWAPAMACGMMFLLLILRLEIQVSDDVMLISFSGTASQMNANNLNKRLDDFAWEQQQWLHMSAMQMMDIQRQNNESLIRTVISQNNQQLKQNFNQLIQYWQSRREQDLQTIGSGYRRVLQQQRQDRLLLSNMIDHINNDNLEPDNLFKRN